MADLTQQINEARQQGHSDDDIVGYLSTSNPDLAPKIKEASSSGYASKDILDHLSTQGSSQPGAGSRAASGFYETTLKPVVDAVSDIPGTAAGFFNKAIGKEDLDAIHQAVQKGDYGGAALHLGKWALRRTPEGMALDQGYSLMEPAIENVKKGNYAGAAGNVFGTAATFALPELAKKLRGTEPPAGNPLTGGAKLPEEAAANTSAALKAGVQETPWGDLADVEQAAAGGDAHARQVLDLVHNSEDVPSRVQQASIALQDYRTGLHADELYRKVDQMANQYAQNGSGYVPPTATSKALDQAIGQASFGIKNRGVVSVLNDVKKAITPAEGKPPDLTYSDMRKLSDQLGEKIRMQSTGDNALIGPMGIQQLQAVKSAIDTDLEGFIRTSKAPALQKAAADADQFYKDVRVPFKDRGLAGAATTDEADTIFQNFIKAGRGDRAQKFYNALDPKGQAAVQYQLVTKAMNDATDVVNGFNSKKFVESIDKLKDAYGTFFQGPDKMAIDGMRNIAVTAAKAEAAPFGKVGAFVPQSEKYARYLMTTPQGRQLLYQASSLKPGSALLKALVNGLSKTAAGAGRTIQAGQVIAPRSQTPEIFQNQNQE